MKSIIIRLLESRVIIGSDAVVLATSGGHFYTDSVRLSETLRFLHIEHSTTDDG